jgi:hypothetical protein
VMRLSFTHAKAVPLEPAPHVGLVQIRTDFSVSRRLASRERSSRVLHGDAQSQPERRVSPGWPPPQSPWAPGSLGRMLRSFVKFC